MDGVGVSPRWNSGAAFLEDSDFLEAEGGGDCLIRSLVGLDGDEFG